MIGRVYKINVNKDNFYIGSTIKSLKERQRNHNVKLIKNIDKCKLYETCRKHNITKIICILLQEQEVEDDLEIRQLEQEYITELQPTLNSLSAYTTKEQYREKNKQRKQQYRKNDPQKFREKEKEYSKKYRENNKDKISERQTEKIKCPICNKIVSRCNIAIHKKTMNCRKSVECFIQDE